MTLSTLFCYNHTLPSVAQKELNQLRLKQPAFPWSSNLSRLTSSGPNVGTKLVARQVAENIAQCSGSFNQVSTNKFHKMWSGSTFQ